MGCTVASLALWGDCPLHQPSLSFPVGGLASRHVPLLSLDRGLRLRWLVGMMMMMTRPLSLWTGV